MEGQGYVVEGDMGVLIILRCPLCICVCACVCVCVWFTVHINQCGVCDRDTFYVLYVWCVLVCVVAYVPIFVCV